MTNTERRTFLKRLRHSDCEPLSYAGISEWEDQHGNIYVYAEDFRNYLIKEGFQGELSRELTVTIIDDKIFLSQAEVVIMVCDIDFSIR